MLRLVNSTSLLETQLRMPSPWMSKDPGPTNQARILLDLPRSGSASYEHSRAYWPPWVSGSSTLSAVITIVPVSTNSVTGWPVRDFTSCWRP